MRRNLCLVILAFTLVFAAGISAANNGWDLNGRVIRIQTRWHDVTPLGPRGAYNWYDPDPMLQAHIESVEKMFNCKIEFVYQGSDSLGIAAVRQGALAGDKPVDFLHVGTNLTRLIDGYIQPLNDIIDDDFYADYPPTFRYGTDQARYGHSVGSQIFGFEALNYQREGLGIHWNISLFEREGLPNLYELAASGDWTYETFYNICQQLTRDTDGDGMIDQVGLLYGGWNAWPATNNVDFVVEKDGKLVFNIDHPDFIDSLEFLARLFREGLATEDNTLAYGMTIGTPLGLDGHNSPAVFGDIYGLVPLPKGPNADQYVAPEQSRWMGVIPIYVENPEAVIEVVSALWQVKAPYIADLDAWEEDYWYQFSMIYPDLESYEWGQWIARNSVLVPRDHVVRRALESNGWRDVLRKIMYENHSVAAAMAELKPAAQALLDEMLGQ